MSLKSRLAPTAMSLALSEPAQALMRGGHEWRRRLLRQPHTVTVYFRVDDPYCLLLFRRLKDLAAACDVTIVLKAIDMELPGGYAPAPDALRDYARRDVRLLAPLLGDRFADAPQRAFDVGLSGAIALLAAEMPFEPALARLLDAMEAYWSGDETTLAAIVAAPGAARLAQARAILATNTAELLRRGHYASAMLFYGGEWYWGVDRLHYLHERLEALGLASAGGSRAAERLRSIASRLDPPLPRRVAPRGSGVLEYYHSFRSPYCYIALARSFRLADRFGLTLDVRPVLPMVLRGLAVPRAKRLYIVRDVSREARRYGIPFGRLADPLHAAERCIALFVEAQRIGREREFLLAAGRAAWADGVDLTDGAALGALARRVGIAAARVDSALAENAAAQLAADNREGLRRAGLWGVPSFRVGDIAVWGQDRLGVLTSCLSRPVPTRQAHNEE